MLKRKISDFIIYILYFITQPIVNKLLYFSKKRTPNRELIKKYNGKEFNINTIYDITVNYVMFPKSIITHNFTQKIIPNVKAKENTYVLIFPGAGSLYENLEFLIIRYLHYGFNVYVFNYPGIGYSKGKTRPDTMYIAADIVYNKILETHGNDINILLHGISMGANTASQLAKNYNENPNIALLIDNGHPCLSETYYKVAKFRVDIYLMKKHVSKFFRNMISKFLAFIMYVIVSRLYEQRCDKNLKNYTGRICVLHSLLDEIVTKEDAYKLAKPDQILEIEGGHRYITNNWRQSNRQPVNDIFEKALVKLDLVCID